MSIDGNVNLGIAGDAPTDPVKLYQRLLAEAVEAKNREALEAYYRENVGSPTDGGPGAALMSEQYALNVRKGIGNSLKSIDLSPAKTLRNPLQSFWI